MRSLADVVQLTSTNPQSGLTESAVEQSKEQFGRNVLTPLPREPLWKKFIEKFDEPIIKILLAAALLSMFVDLFKASPPLAGGGLVAVVVGVIAALFVGAGRWVPTVLFGSAVVIFG